MSKKKDASIMIVQAGRQQAKNIFTVLVNYSCSIADAIKSGNYDWANDDITQKHFPTNRSSFVTLDIELVHFNKDMSTDEVIAELDKKGLRPVELHELLALGEKHSDLQREFPIIALGSVWQRPFGRYCPYLGGDGSERSLRLSCLGCRWSGYCRFAAVRK